MHIAGKRRGCVTTMSAVAFQRKLLPASLGLILLAITGGCDPASGQDVDSSRALFRSGHHGDDDDSFDHGWGGRDDDDDSHGWGHDDDSHHGDDDHSHHGDDDDSHHGDDDDSHHGDDDDSHHGDDDDSHHDDDDDGEGGTDEGGVGGSTDEGGTDEGGTDEGGTDEGGTDGGGDNCKSIFEGEGDIGELNDEFGDPSTLSCWFRNDVEEGTPAEFSAVDIDASTPDHLTLFPTPSGWFRDEDGPFFYKKVTGDFMIEVQVEATSLTDFSLPPSLPFSSAGILVRDPASSTVPNAENWVMYDVGRQRAFVGTEGKTTVESDSVLILQPGPNSGRLRICRVGSTVILARRLAGEAVFTQRHVFDRPDFADLLQVGMCATAFNVVATAPDPTIEPDLRAAWDYVRFSSIATEADCLAE